MVNILLGIVFIFSIVSDQLSKLWASEVLKNGSDIKLIGDFLGFTYVENRGAAFGMLQNRQWFFIVVTVVMLCVLAYIFFRFKNITQLSRLALVFIGGGAIGNFADRTRFGFVVDFIHVRFGSFYDFPVFNIADSFVVCGTFLLIILILFNKFEKSDLNG